MAEYTDRLTRERQQFIRDFANDEWIDRDPGLSERDPAKWKALSAEYDANRDTFLNDPETPPAELFYFVESWNWDGGSDVMRRVALHPNCDAATALSVYWHAEPQFYLQFDSRDAVPEWARVHYDLGQFIEAKYLRGEYAVGYIGYSPRKNWRIQDPVPGQRTVPDAMTRDVVARAS